MSNNSLRKGQNILPIERIERKIYLIRGHKVMFDADLAELYQVPTKALNQAVKRNLDRFPADFMFQMTAKEAENLRSQIVTSSWGGACTLPACEAQAESARLEQASNANLPARRRWLREGGRGLGYGG